MKKLVFILIVLTATVGNTTIFCKEKTINHEKEIEQTVQTQIDSFSVACLKLQEAVTSGNSAGEELQKLFLTVRLAYKKLEWAAEYFIA